MRANGLVAQRERYTITDAGRQDLVDAEVCHCEVKLSGLILECPMCGTVYGSLREWSAASSSARPKAD